MGNFGKEKVFRCNLMFSVIVMQNGCCYSCKKVTVALNLNFQLVLLPTLIWSTRLFGGNVKKNSSNFRLKSFFLQQLCFLTFAKQNMFLENNVAFKIAIIRE